MQPKIRVKSAKFLITLLASARFFRISSMGHGGTYSPSPGVSSQISGKKLSSCQKPSEDMFVADGLKPAPIPITDSPLK